VYFFTYLLTYFNSDAACHLGFDRKWIFTISRPQENTTHRHRLFQHNRTRRGLAVDDLTNFHGGGTGGFVAYSSQLSGYN